MPTEHTRWSWSFDELTEEAQGKAVQAIAEKLSGDWWDNFDNERVAETMIFAFAEALKSPGWDEYGQGDFPGINGIKLDEWQVSYDPYIGLTGTLTRENAPGLDWPEHADVVELDGNGHHGTRVHVTPLAELEYDCTQCGQRAAVSLGWESNITYHVLPDGRDDQFQDADHAPFRLEGLPTVDRDALNGFEQTVRDAVSAALEAGEKEAEYIGSEENARGFIDGNEPDFNEDGTLF